jgi:hypothetical protein
MFTRKKQAVIYAVLALALIIGAFFVAYMNKVPSTSQEGMGI